MCFGCLLIIKISIRNKKCFQICVFKWFLRFVSVVSTHLPHELATTHSSDREWARCHQQTYLESRRSHRLACYALQRQSTKRVWTAETCLRLHAQRSHLRHRHKRRLPGKFFVSRKSRENICLVTGFIQCPFQELTGSHIVCQCTLWPILRATKPTHQKQKHKSRYNNFLVRVD